MAPLAKKKKVVEVNIGDLCLDKKSVESGRRLFENAQSIVGTLGERYLAARGIDEVECADLRFAFTTYHGKDGRRKKLPTLLDGIRGSDGEVFSVNRTYLSDDGCDKADVGCPKKVVSVTLTASV